MHDEAAEAAAGVAAPDGAAAPSNATALDDAARERIQARRGRLVVAMQRAGGTVPLLRLPPTVGAQSGSWRREGGDLVVEPAGGAGHLTMAMAPRGSYRLDVELTAPGNGEAALLVPVSETASVCVVLSGRGSEIHGVADAKLADEADGRPKLRRGERQRWSVEVTLGEEIAIGVRQGPRDAVACRVPRDTAFGAHARLKPSRPGALALGALRGPVAWHEATLVMRSGRAVRVR